MNYLLQVLVKNHGSAIIVIILKKGKIPGQATLNNLALKIPEELSCLNSLEFMLIFKIILLMKLVTLPKAEQIRIPGAAVNVPTNTICNILTRIPTETKIPFELKIRYND